MMNIMRNSSDVIGPIFSAEINAIRQRPACAHVFIPPPPILTVYRLVGRRSSGRFFKYSVVVVKLMVNEPRGAPLGSEMVIMGGTFGNINAWGDRIYNTPRTKSLDPRKRKCYFGDESTTGMGTNYYMRRNCKAACYMDYVVQKCGCYLEFMFALMSREWTRAFFARFRSFRLNRSTRKHDNCRKHYDRSRSRYTRDRNDFLK